MEEPGLRTGMCQVYVCLAQALAEEASCLNLDFRCLVNQCTKRIRTCAVGEHTRTRVVAGQHINHDVQENTQRNTPKSPHAVSNNDPNQTRYIRSNRGTRTSSPQQSRENHNGKNDFNLVTGEAQNQQAKETIHQTREILITQPAGQTTIVASNRGKTGKIGYRVEKNRRRVSKNNRTNMQTPSSNSPNQHCRSD